MVFPDRAPARHDILVQGGKIAALLASGAAAPAGIPEQSAAGLHVFAGLIDAHVHFGFGEKITEYSTETAYAAHQVHGALGATLEGPVFQTSRRIRQLLSTPPDETGSREALLEECGLQLL